MQMCGNRAILTAYIRPEIYNFLVAEKGSAKMSTYVSDLLEAYADMVKSEEQNQGVYENNEQKGMVIFKGL